jgi:glycosyltransferase involved in cell wall biosynthesis
MLRRLGSTLLIPDTYIGWYPYAVREGRQIIETQKIDAIYSTSPPETSHLVGARLHELTGLPWVADFRDPWMNLYLLQRPTRLHDRLHERLERRVCSRAAAVVTNRWHLDVLRKKYPAMARMKLIPNGYDPAHIEQVLELTPPVDRFQIVHAGMLTQKRSAVPFLKALRVFLDRFPGAEDTCRALFLGPRESENDDAVEQLRLGAVVSFRNTVPHHEALNIERSSHILLLIKHTNPVYNGIVPGKLFEYIGVRRPILALAPDGEASDIVRRFKRGEVAPQDDAELIADRIETMYRKHRGGTLETDYDLTPVTEYGRDVLTRRLAKYLDTLSAGRD